MQKCEGAVNIISVQLLKFHCGVIAVMEDKSKWNHIPLEYLKLCAWNKMLMAT